MADIIAQIGITIFGLLGIILVAKKIKWGFVFGFLSQPFWFLTAYLNEQWGVFILSLAYTFSWCLGIYEWFFKKEKEKT